MIRTNVLLLGAGGPAGINFIKSLREDKEIDYKIIGVDCNKHHLEFIKPFVEYYELVPKNNNDEYLNSIQKIISKYDINFIHAQPDSEVKWLSEHRDLLNAKIFLPDKDVIDIFQNKELSTHYWYNTPYGLSSKVIRLTSNYREELSIAFAEFDKVWLRATRGAGGKGSLLCENIMIAINWIKLWRSKKVDWEFIAQEYLPGRNLAWQSVWYNGTLITSQGRERIEYIYPYLAPSGVTGTPIIAKTINETKLNEIAISSIKTVDQKPHGIYCVDLKEDKKGIPIPTEINIGRFFTTSYFFTKAGVTYNVPLSNMPSIYIRLGMNLEIPEGPNINILPSNLFWYRHIDIPATLIKKENK